MHVKLMIMILSLLAATTAIYGFKPTSQFEYSMNTVFDGFIPILGGQEGKAEVKLSVVVGGLEGQGPNLKVASELTAAKLLFNDAELPLGLENLQEFFPKTTIECTPWGKILKTDAPDKSLPVKLPGLDVKRFPDITYMPVEFPQSQIEVGNPWTFVKPFAGSDVKYTCTPTKLDGTTLTIKVELEQKYTVLEGASLEVVQDRQDAEREVTTTLKGGGEALFDTQLGAFRKYSVQATAFSEVRNLHDAERSERTLKTSLKVDLVRPKPEK